MKNFSNFFGLIFMLPANVLLPSAVASHSSGFRTLLSSSVSAI